MQLTGIVCSVHHANLGTVTLVSFVVVCVLQFNFVGRILGPRGMTAKQLEQETGCKIMVRGKGSMRDKQKVCTKPFNVFVVEEQIRCEVLL